MVDSHIWNPSVECLPSHKLREQQIVKLNAVLEYVSQNSSFYQNKFREESFFPHSVQSFQDLSQIPFTNKDELREAYPWKLLSVPRSQLLRLHASSGSTGNPTLVAYTCYDLEVWAECTARALFASGVRPGVLIQNAYSYGLFTGGLGFQYGAEKIGACILPISSGDVLKQCKFIEDLKPDFLLCTPSFAACLLETYEKEGEKLSHVLNTMVLGGEVWSEALRKRLQKIWNVKLFDTYGLSEVMGPGVAHECALHDGLHVYEDHFLIEIIDPISGEACEAGQQGEIVITTLTKEAMPLLRYRTGDFTSWVAGACSCGRTLRKIKKLQGRAQEKIRVGVKDLFIAQLEQLCLEHEELSCFYQIAFEDLAFRKGPCLRVESRFSEMDHEVFKNKLEHEMLKRWGVFLPVEITSPGSLPRFFGKSNRMVQK